ncbi:MAG: hypothetical protein E7316_06660 [Clostridiales bacterium]|nr:hypothetical protein [Clostridiales bacterium]
MDLRLIQATDFLRGTPFTWAVCGGYALDLFHGHSLRSHGDIDICTLEPDRASILSFILRKGWQVCEFRGQGKVRPLDAASVSEKGRNLMCFTKDCQLIRFYPCEDEGLLYHEFLHGDAAPFNYIEFLFNQTYDNRFLFDAGKNIGRELSKAIVRRDDIPYLAPELVLMYKASSPDMDKNLFDFLQAYPLMNGEQKSWFTHSLAALYPDGHPWQDML